VLTAVTVKIIGCDVVRLTRHKFTELSVDIAASPFGVEASSKTSVNFYQTSRTHILGDNSLLNNFSTETINPTTFKS